ncbi:MAG: hypothetical protein U0939_26575 [Pirellulales bacterium]
MARSDWRILVEARKHPAAQLLLDLIAESIADAGHHVVRWRGPSSGRVSCGRVLWDCDVAFLFNGTTLRYQPVLEHLRRNGASVVFLELGWHPQSSTMQLDLDGINADASWVAKPLPRAGVTPLSVRPDGDLLVLLQDECDTQITRHSAHFQRMDDFIAFLADHSALPLRVRAHPKFPPGKPVEELVRRRGLAWDDCQSLGESLRDCRAVACVNSSGAVEALQSRLPVICFGRAVYRHSGAVYCLERSGAELAAATQELLDGRSSLFAERVDDVVERIIGQQWTPAEIPGRIPALLDVLLAQRAAPATSGRLSWRDFFQAAPTLWTTYLEPKMRGIS